MDVQNPTEEMRLKRVSELLKESQQIYRSKIKTIFGIMAVLVGFNVFSEIFIGLLNNTDIKYSVLFSAVLVVTSLVSLFLWFLSIPSLLFAIREDIGIKESYGKSFKVLIPYAWVYFLVNALILGGFIFLVIPGILFSVWFSLAIFALVLEDRRGLGAILRSKFLVSGNFWKVLLRLLVLGMVTLILPMLMLVLIDRMNFSGAMIVGVKDVLRFLVNYSLEFFTIPFALVYGYLVYGNLEEIKRETPYQESSLAGKLKYALPGILGAFVIGLMVLVWSLNIVWGRDEMPPDDSDLMLTKVETTNQEDNAFYWLAPWIGDPKDLSGRSTMNELVSKYWPEGKERMKESKKIYWPQDQDKIKLIDDMIAGKTWDAEFEKELWENNKEMFDDFDKAASSSYFQDPVMRDPDNINPFALLFPVGQYRNIAKLELLKASYSFKQGKEKEAFDEDIKVIRFGHLIKGSQNTLIDYLLASAIKEMGLNEMRLMLAKTTLPPEDLKNYNSQLEGLKDDGQWLVKAMKGEYMSFVNAKKVLIDPVYEGKISGKELGDAAPYDPAGGMAPQLIQEINYLYKPNQTQRLFAEDARARVINASKEYCSEMNFDEEKIYSISSRANSLGPAMIFTENPIGNILYSISATSLSGAFQKKCNENFSVTGTQTLMALKAYKTEKGDLPLSLNDLVPGYLSEVPKDSFDGKPIRYSREKKIIYSVGQDLKDSSGNTNSEHGEKKMDDISYKIEF